jgi:hypothetical protein
LGIFDSSRLVSGEVAHFFALGLPPPLLGTLLGRALRSNLNEAISASRNGFIITV